MKKYNAPVCEIASIDTRDIMTVSGFGASFSWDNPTAVATVDMNDNI